MTAHIHTLMNMLGLYSLTRTCLLPPSQTSKPRQKRWVARDAYSACSARGPERPQPTVVDVGNETWQRGVSCTATIASGDRRGGGGGEPRWRSGGGPATRRSGEGGGGASIRLWPFACTPSGRACSGRLGACGSGSGPCGAFTRGRSEAMCHRRRAALPPSAKSVGSRGCCGGCCGRGAISRRGAVKRSRRTRTCSSRWSWRGE